MNEKWNGQKRGIQVELKKQGAEEFSDEENESLDNWELTIELVSFIITTKSASTRQRV